MFQNSERPVIGISTCMDVGKRINPERTYQFIEISYAEAVAEAGAIPLILPYLKEDFRREDALDGIDGLLLPGGEDLQSNVPDEIPQTPLTLTPDCLLEQDRWLLEGALARRLPILGICYGMQLINLHFGGTLYYDIPHQLPSAGNHKPGDAAYRHPVAIKSGTRLGAILGSGEISANSGHHQAVRDLGTGFVLAAECEDGIVEAIESTTSDFIIGVQWHPEKIRDENRRKLFSAFAEACARGGGKK